MRGGGFRLLTTAGLLALGLVGAARAADALVQSSNRAIPITFKFEADRATTMPVEVQLDISEDHGKSWHLAGRTRPEAGRFVYQAPHDGEYWFAVRSLDPQGKLHPEGPLTPALRVVVDTQLPKLELEAHRGKAGEIEIHCRGTDQHLKPTTFRLSYQPVGMPNEGWQPVAVDPLRFRQTGESFDGATVLWPDSNDRLVLRAELCDQAGNRSLAQIEVDATPKAPIVQPSKAGTDEQIAHGRREPTGETIDAPPPQREEIVDSGRNAVPNMPRTFPISKTDDAPSGPNLSATPLPPPRTSPSWSPTRPAPLVGGPDLGPIRGAPRQPAQSVDAELLPEPPLKAAKNPMPAASTTRSDTELPAGVRPPMVNKRRFELEYDVASIGPEGVGKVELWATRDGGRNWDLWQVDDDNRSPMVVNVPAEGMYGFRIVVETANGLRGALPRSGELPEIWVGVDNTPPTAELVVDGAAAGARPGELSIHWHADDAQLAPRPITLSYGESAQGPWTTIAAGLENSGRYDWKLDNRAPDQIFVRLEVRDEAGNATTIVTSKPVSIERVRPQAKLLNVRPVPDATEN